MDLSSDTLPQKPRKADPWHWSKTAIGSPSTWRKTCCQSICHRTNWPSAGERGRRLRTRQLAARSTRTSRASDPRRKAASLPNKSKSMRLRNAKFSPRGLLVFQIICQPFLVCLRSPNDTRCFSDKLARPCIAKGGSTASSPPSMALRLRWPVAFTNFSIWAMAMLAVMRMLVSPMSVTTSRINTPTITTTIIIITTVVSLTKVQVHRPGMVRPITRTTARFARISRPSRLRRRLSIYSFRTPHAKTCRRLLACRSA